MLPLQNPELRKRFCGKPEYVINFMKFVASELREYMSKLGVKTVDELVGRIDLIKRKEGITGQAAEVDLSNILDTNFVSEKVEYNKKSLYDFKLNQHLTKESSAKNCKGSCKRHKEKG